MEIGSEFDLDFTKLLVTDDTIFNYLKEYQTIYLDSGRSALALLFSKLEPGKILLPSYLCESVIKSIPEDFRIVLYDVDDKFRVDIEKLKTIESKEVKYFYLMNYFGDKVEKELVSYIRARGYVIIEDTTHCLLSDKKITGDYAIASIRKWFPIPDGGVLYSTQSLKKWEDVKIQSAVTSSKLVAMILKNQFLHNNLDCKELYRSMFQESEEALNKKTENLKMSDTSKFLLRHFSCFEIFQRRKKNYRYLFERLSVIGYPSILGPLNDDELPFNYPVYVENRDALRRYLMDNNIFCAVHWPIENTILRENLNAVNLSRHIISLNTDQRYEQEDMQYIIYILKQYALENGK